ncbi:DUF759 family protein [Borrelia puertoricensis]|uniref:DUF759 family protein n=1 Tax=Borrelia puertoricensis TaxID=2756107 RepID=UPI001FF1E242|nr:DUF759 family protein [Borrelia puertoricensis]UPA18850.1 DUF759 family protein [Borrelia puertoricensis]UPA18887.1 DUF759 family protein [Borrelia puertoricensis]
MNTTKFTIKFKGVLDHASTRKSLESDISKLERLIKPKRSHLKSTKDILKHNLYEKKRELSKQNKYERLREGVEKFRLSETKKLIKLGYTFENARRKAFKHSLMSTKELRLLEYENLKRGRHKEIALNKTVQSSILKGASILKIAAGTALGNAVSSGASGIFSYAKKSLEDNAKLSKTHSITSKVFTEGEKKSLSGMLKGISGFERDLEREDFLNLAGIIRKELVFLGQNNESNLKKAVEFAAKLKSTGVVDDTNSATKAVVEFLQGKSGPLYDIMSSFKEFTGKYNERAAMEYDILAPGQALDYRSHKLKEVINDWNSLKFPTYSSSSEEAKSSLEKLNDTGSKLTAKVLEPLVTSLNKILDWALTFNFQTHVTDPLIKGIKSIFSLDALIARLKAILPKFLGGDGGKSLDKLKTEEDSSIRTP